MKALYDSAYAQINFNKHTQTLELIWKETVTDLTYKDAFLKGLHFLKKTNATSWISDIRRQTTVKAERSEWLRKHIIPKTKETHLKKIAIVTAEDSEKFKYLNEVKQSLDDCISMRYFNTIEKAYGWIKEEEQ